MNRRARSGPALVIAVALVMTLAGATAVLATSHHHRDKLGLAARPVDAQTIIWRTGKTNQIGTKSTEWEDVELLQDGCNPPEPCHVVFPDPLMVWAKGPISVTFSGVFADAPVEIRFRDGSRVMMPGPVGFRPNLGAGAFSFTFVSDRKGGRECEGPQLQWRSPSGQSVRLKRATLVVHYKRYDPPETFGGCQ